MTILELREKRNTAWNAAKAFLDSHRTEKGTLTAEDDATYSRMEQEIADLGIDYEGQMGKLTMNLGVIKYVKETGDIELDLRCPHEIDLAKMDFVATNW